MRYIDDRIKSMLTNQHSTQGYPKTAQGNPCELIDPSITPIGNTVFYGNSVQDGIPTPENPIEIQSVGDLVTDENDENYGKYLVPVKVHGKNLIDISKITLLYDASVNGVKLLSHYERHYSTRENLKDFLNVEANKTYMISAKHSHPNDGGTYVYLKGSGRTWEFGKSIKLTQADLDGQMTFYKCRSADNPVVNKEVIITEIQIVENTSETEYESFFNETINLYLDQPLRKAGGYADYIDWENKKLVTNTKDIVLKGTENWKYNSSTQDFLAPFDAEFKSYVSRFPVLCNEYSTNQPRGTGNTIIVGLSNKHIFICDKRFTTAEDFKTWLASRYDVGNPVIITTGNQSPTSKLLDLPDLPIIPHLTNIISTESNVKGDIKVNYHSFTKEE